MSEPTEEAKGDADYEGETRAKAKKPPGFKKGRGRKQLGKQIKKALEPSPYFKTSEQRYVCPICVRKYPKAQALGGHMSKAHPHMSGQYQYKQQRRMERSDDRKLLTAAKAIYYE